MSVNQTSPVGQTSRVGQSGQVSQLQRIDIAQRLGKIVRRNGVTTRQILMNPNGGQQVDCCIIPHFKVILTRERLFKYTGGNGLKFSKEQSSRREQSFFSLPIDESPFAMIKKIGNTDEIVASGAFLSFREIMSVLRQSDFREPTYIPVVIHERLKDFRLAIVRVWDGRLHRTIRTAFEGGAGDLFEDGVYAKIIVRPEHLKIVDPSSAWFLE